MGGITVPYMEGGEENLPPPLPYAHERNPAADRSIIQECGRISKEVPRKTIPDRVGI